MSQELDSQSQKIGGMLPWIMLIVGCVFIFIAGLQVRYNQRNAENLRHTSGRIERLYTEKRGGPENSRPDTVRMVAYSFEADHHAYGGSSALNDSDWREMKIGGPIPITYLYDDPTMNLVDFPSMMEGLAGIPLVVALMGFAALAASLIIFLARPRRPVTQTSLDRVSDTEKIY